MKASKKWNIATDTGGIDATPGVKQVVGAQSVGGGGVPGASTWGANAYTTVLVCAKG